MTGLSNYVHFENEVSAYIHVFRSVFESNGNIDIGRKLFGSQKSLTSGNYFLKFFFRMVGRIFFNE